MNGSKRVVATGCLLAVIIIPFGLGEGYALQVVDIALINAVVVVGLNFVTG